VAKKFQLAERASVHLNLIREFGPGVMLARAWTVLVDFPLLGTIFRVPCSLRCYRLRPPGRDDFFRSQWLFHRHERDRFRELQRCPGASYLVNRLTRLPTGLFPALGSWRNMDQIGMRIPQAASFYYGGLYKYFCTECRSSLHNSVFFGNLFLLQEASSHQCLVQTPALESQLRILVLPFVSGACARCRFLDGNSQPDLYVALAALLLGLSARRSVFTS